MSHDIRPITPAQARQLRHLLLRPFEPPEKIVYHGDDDPDTLHAGAFADGRLVGIASVCREPMPAARIPLRTGPEVWRLRGMATTPDVRGAGHGRALLLGCFDHIRSHGGDLLWCNARVVALDFYARLGFVAEGEEFEIVPIGPHYVMTKDLHTWRPLLQGTPSQIVGMPCASVTA